MTDPKRILIAIGCDAYNFIRPLRGAELDASDIFSTLISPEYGNYPIGDAILMKSPTYDELIATLRSVFVARAPLDTVTFFFAGHGDVIGGSYYLCVRDSTPTMLSATALPLNLLFTIINEVRPAQCNIIIDACHGGGLVVDIGTLLKPELIGGANTPGISIFASSAANEYALDTAQGGLGTTALLECIKGFSVVQTQRPYLDLIEVGRAAAEKLAQSSVPQTPVVWGLNLFGQSRFAKNPHFAGTATSSLYQLTSIPTASPAGQKITAHANDLWRIYYALPGTYDPRDIWTALTTTASALGTDDAGAASFILGITRALAARCAESSDLFREVEVLALGAAALLPLTSTNNAVDQVMELLTRELLAQLNAVLAQLSLDLERAPRSLVIGGLADLFYLPIRVTRILGWLGAGLILSELIGAPDALNSNAYRNLVGQLLEVYAPSLLAITDAQSPFAMTFFTAAAKKNWKEEHQAVLTRLFNSLISTRGKIAAPDLAPEKTLSYLLRRSLSTFESIDYSLIAQPIELLPTLLLAADQLELADVVDPLLEKIDHLSFKIFIPNDHRRFADESISEGRNHVFQIGHGIWRASDLSARWREACLPQLASDAALVRATTQIGALVAAMLFPDRTPWFASPSLTEPALFATHRS